MGTVSVALATYNGARYLGQQLASLAAQTRPPDELVVGDDNSTDQTRAIVEAFAATAPFPVRLHVNARNLGPGANFAATIRRCTGTIVFPCDQDDIWEPAKLARMVDFLAARPGCLLAVHDGLLVDAAGAGQDMTLADQIRAIGADPATGLMHGCCMAIDSRLAMLFDPALPMRSHDSWIVIAADALGARAYCDEPLIRHRRHDDNASVSYMGQVRRTGWVRAQVLRGRQAFAEPPARSLEATIAARQGVAEAIRAHWAALATALPEARIAAAIARLERALAQDRARLALHRASGLARLRLWRQAFAQGCYGGRFGLLSLARDLAFTVLPLRT